MTLSGSQLPYSTPQINSRENRSRPPLKCRVHWTLLPVSYVSGALFNLSRRCNYFNRIRDPVEFRNILPVNKLDSFFYVHWYKRLVQDPCKKTQRQTDSHSQLLESIHDILLMSNYLSNSPPREMTFKRLRHQEKEKNWLFLSRLKRPFACDVLKWKPFSKWAILWKQKPLFVAVKVSFRPFRAHQKR